MHGPGRFATDHAAVLFEDQLPEHLGAVPLSRGRDHPTAELEELDGMRDPVSGRRFDPIIIKKGRPGGRPLSSHFP